MLNLIGNHWIGLNLSEPNTLEFSVTKNINTTAAKQLSCVEVAKIPKAGGPTWWISRKLDSEEVHFFSRSKLRQMQWLEGFLGKCLAQARSVETPDQPPPDSPLDAST